MSQNQEAKTPKEKESGGIFHRLFDRREEQRSATVSKPAESILNLEDIQGFILRGYRMPMVRHFLLR